MSGFCSAHQHYEPGCPQCEMGVNAIEQLRAGLIEHSGIPDDRDRCGECGMVLPAHRDGCHGAAAFNALAAVDALYQAAGPMARLPYPLSADERQQWLVHQNVLRDALARVEGALETSLPENYREALEAAQAQVAALTEVARAARELLTHVLMPVDPTAEDIKRIVGLDVALSKAGE